MSPVARRYFGCVLPFLLCVFGCGTTLLIGYAGQVIVQVERMPDASMSPLLKPGWLVVVNNAAYWDDDPRRGQIVSLKRPDGWAIRRVVAVPGDTVEVRDGRVRVDGRDRDPGYDPHGTGPNQPALALGADEYFVIADDREAPDSRVWGALGRSDIVGIVIFQIDPQREVHSVLVTPTPGATPAPAATP